jgi:AraC-like DNA-binding protein
VDVNYIRTEVTDTHELAFAEAAPVAQDAAGGAVARLFTAIAAIEAPPAGAPAGGRRHAPSGLAPWQALRVRSYVEAALADDINVGRLAQIARLSSSHFARAFRATFGVTPAAYVVARRVERAKLLMLGTSGPLSQISLDCGFTDQSHLSRAFRRHVGQPPGQWRRWHRVT